MALFFLREKLQGLKYSRKCVDGLYRVGSPKEDLPLNIIAYIECPPPPWASADSHRSKNFWVSSITYRSGSK